MGMNKRQKKTATLVFFEMIAVFQYLVEHIGLEPMTFCMPCRRSSQLS